MQLDYGQAPRAVAGLVSDNFMHEYISRLLSTKQLELLTFGTTDGTYTVTINGVLVGTYAATSAAAATIRDDILADIAASAAPVKVEAVSTTQLLIEKKDYGDAFTIAISTVSGYSIAHLVAQGAEVPFGVGLCKDDRATVSGKQCRLPRLAADITAGFLGIAALDTAKQANAGGWPTKSFPKLMRMGRIWVNVEGAIAELAPVYCRYAAGAGGTQLGAFRADTDSTTAAAVPGMRTLGKTAAAGLVECELIPTN